MKTLIKLFVLPLLIGLMSCEQKNEIKLDRLTELTNRVTSSTQFTSLKIKLTDLNLEGSNYVNASKNSISIPFAGLDDRKGVLAVFGPNDALAGVLEFEVLTTVAPDQIDSELRNGRFNGTLVLRVGVSEFSFQLENSKVKSSSLARMDNSALAFVCRLPDELLACIVNSINNMDWFERTYCYTSYLTCMANLAIMCMSDGCMFNFS
jgi:hypothetical protein